MKLHNAITRTQKTSPTQSVPKKSIDKKKWLKVIEFAVVGFATWCDPTAGGLIFLLRFCFQILQALQNDRPK
ncbi:MAG: hypothetical protein B0A82_18610 [Alkalinema sp. CACIAM 70d]|nr:MAG: hypothetical protein B0A82_18610 [Alkalinema sp. CACIAM 70d]